MVRGGFGLFYDQNLGYLLALERSNARIALVPNPGTTDASQIAIDSSGVPASPTVLGREMRTPFTRQISLGLERALGAGFVARVDGILVAGRNLPISRELNVRDASGTPRFPAYASIIQSLNRGEASAKMLLMRLTKRLRGGWIDLAYTLADRKATNDVWFQRSPQIDPASEDFGGELGPAAWDEQHRFVGLAGGSLPSRLDATVKVVYASGRPVTAVTGTDDNGDSILNDRLPGEGRAARRGPDYFVVDVSLARSVQVGSSELGIRLNVYNLLNRTNLSPYSVIGNLQSPSFGLALAALPRRQVELGLEARF